jgi:hypothetical protein
MWVGRRRSNESKSCSTYREILAPIIGVVGPPWVLAFMTTKINTTPPVPCSIADTNERHGRMLTVKELALIVAESPKTTYARVKRGSQPATLIGGAIRFDPHVTAEWIGLRSA